MKNVLNLMTICLASIMLASCAHSETQDSFEKDVLAVVPTSLDPLGLGDDPVNFERRRSNACPGTEGGEMWYAKLSGIMAVKVTYGVRSKGADTGQRHTFSLNPNFSREKSLFCTGDGIDLDFEPFVVEFAAP